MPLARTFPAREALSPTCRKLRIAAAGGSGEKGATAEATNLILVESIMNAIFQGSSTIPVTASRSGYVIRRAPAAHGVTAALGQLVRFVDSGFERAVEELFTWQRRLADRRALESMDERMLRDIGVSRAEVYAETSKPFWKS
jgi:uncharacterized protein YjiS (DUF1127 family)